MCDRASAFFYSRIVATKLSQFCFHEAQAPLLIVGFMDQQNGGEE
jgi:hypothetical protein